MRAIDHHAWTNRWAGWHPAEKGLPAGGLLLLTLFLPPLTTAPLVGQRSPLVAGGWVPQAGSALVDAAVPAPAGVAAVPILWQLDAAGRTQARVTKGTAPDLGAVEQ